MCAAVFDTPVRFGKVACAKPHSRCQNETAVCVQGGKCTHSPQSLPLALPASTGCIGALGQCTTTLTITLPVNCTDDMQAPYPTVLMLAGHQVPMRYYNSLAKSLAQNGFAVMQVLLLTTP